MPRQPTDITGSRRRRRRARAVRLVLRGLVVVALLALAGGVVWAVGYSPWLAATNVVVRGASVLTPEQIVAAAQVPLGTPLARLDTRPIETRVKALSPVSTVSVSRGWPHTVVVTVVERRPAFVLRSPGGTLTLVDRGGVPYYEVRIPPDGLVSAKVTNPDGRVLRDVATVVTALPPAVRDHATRVTVDTVDHIVIELDGGRTLVWGSAEQSDVKAQVVAALIRVPASVYDVSAPSHPATRE